MELYIIAGPNGVGKDNLFARVSFPLRRLQELREADLVAQRVAPFFPEAAAFRTGRMMLNRSNRLRKSANLGVVSNRSACEIHRLRVGLPGLTLWL